MYSNVLFVLAVASLTTQFVHGYPSGPPVGNVKGLCESMDPTGHGPSQATGEAPYTISVSSSSYGDSTASPIQVTIKANEGEHFEGLFVQARRLDSSKGSLTEALGLFSEQPSDTQLLNCGGMKKNAWGHKDKKTKTEKTITWTAPETGDQGPLAFVATLVKGPKEIYWMDVKSSQLTFSGGKINKEYPGKYDSLKLRYEPYQLNK